MIPSMRPRMIIRGNATVYSATLRGYVPSMRPRMIIRGNPADTSLMWIYVQPSMRPRMIIRGNGILPYSRAWLARLQ